MEKEKLDLRERVFARGMSYPSNSELLMLILGSGTRQIPVEEIAYRMEEKIDVLPREDLVDGLLSIPGVGLGKAMAVAAALEFGRRQSSHLGAIVKEPKDLVPFITQYGYKQTEHFITVSLSGAHEILNQNVIAMGNTSRAIVNAREVFFEAVKNRASAVILAHNHPSGDVEPSAEDLDTTRHLLAAAEILGISVLDHIIVSRGKYLSFREKKILGLGALD